MNDYGYGYWVKDYGFVTEDDRILESVPDDDKSERVQFKLDAYDDRWCTEHNCHIEQCADQH